MTRIEDDQTAPRSQLRRQEPLPRAAQLVLSQVSCNRLIEEVVTLTRARWNDQPQQRGVLIELRTELAEDLPNIMGSEVEIRDALTKLIFNAVDAMPDGGTLLLRTRLVASSSRPGDSATRHVHLEVTDTGLGMDEETRKRCLEPFYTTKGARSTGLGLTTVYGMAQLHGADLQIQSTPARGTSVSLVFAVTEKSGSTAAPGMASRGLAQPLRILLVDDDPLLVKSLRDVLEQDGHAVTVAEGGQKGIDVFAAALARGTPFALVITDLGMPYVDGRNVAAAIKAASPQTPLILLTGWGNRLQVENDIPAHVDRLLGKPPRLAQLRAALAELTAMTPEQTQSDANSP
jgi:CheY-like chemotaxis protein